MRSEYGSRAARPPSAGSENIVARVPVRSSACVVPDPVDCDAMRRHYSVRQYVPMPGAALAPPGGLQDKGSPPMDTTALGSLTLPGVDGADHRLADLWRDRPVVLIFLRHFG